MTIVMMTVVIRTAVMQRYLCVTIPPAVRPNLLRKTCVRSLTCAHIWVRAAHTKGEGEGAGTNKSAQELTRRDRQTARHLAPPGD